ncbi:uncharacterized protein LOC106673937 isoform X2 [Cimex lectularius]|nr:uncharacterized protein LOC106673937 isoform X2 [Cimex lectularius]XP_014261815.1 uncharacterized protein LOC106673937 isoform X2 [Cimex lectularius]XP_014261817.1 uncharacterized protein LOC106673937 isoform X2 [Cimex lectularius]
MKSEVFLVWGSLVTLLYAAEVKSQCSQDDYNYCVRLADPLLNDVRLIYPDNPKDIEQVCRIWNVFIDCFKKYTDRCFTEAKRQEFHKAVENSMSSIHKLCFSPDYRTDYLKHASCMKKTVTQESYCGKQYKLLVAQVSNEAPTIRLCCSNQIFRECVLQQTKSMCDPASVSLSTSIIDEALGFLRDQCANVILNPLDCPNTDLYKTTSRSRGADQDVTVTTWAMTDSRSTPSSTSEMSEAWTPPSRTSEPTRTSETSRSSETTRTSEASRTTTSETGRPSETTRTSFGRGMTWTVSSSDIWLPSSKPPAMIDNAIDEPNQQGLESGNSGSIKIQTITTNTLIVLCIVFYLIR